MRIDHDMGGTGHKGQSVGRPPRKPVKPLHIQYSRIAHDSYGKRCSHLTPIGDSEVYTTLRGIVQLLEGVVGFGIRVEITVKKLTQ